MKNLAVLCLLLAACVTDVDTTNTQSAAGAGSVAQDLTVLGCKIESIVAPKPDINQVRQQISAGLAGSWSNSSADGTYKFESVGGNLLGFTTVAGAMFTTWTHRNSISRQPAIGQPCGTMPDGRRDATEIWTVMGCTSSNITACKNSAKNSGDAVQPPSFVPAFKVYHHVYCDSSNRSFYTVPESETWVQILNSPGVTQTWWKTNLWYESKICPCVNNQC